MKTDKHDIAKRARAAAKQSLLPDRSAALATASKAAALSRDMKRLALECQNKIASLKESFKTQLEEKGKEYKDLVKQLNKWSIAHREAEYGEEQSISLAGHKLAFRVSPGKVEFADGVDEEIVVEALLNLDDEDFSDQFLRYTTTLNKEAIGEKWDVEKEILSRIGVRFVKPEAFIFTPDESEEVTTKVTITQPQPPATEAALQEAA